MNYNYQPHMPPPPPPRKKRTGMWISIAAGVVLFVGTLAYLAMKVGRKFGSKMTELSQTATGFQDSMTVSQNDALYESLEGQLGQDSLSDAYRTSIDSLRERTNRLCARFDHYRQTFRDTLQQEKAGMLNKEIPHAYFIRSGRALELKKEVLRYREQAVNGLPYGVRDPNMKSRLMVDEAAKMMPGGLKKLVTWENMYFNQPSMTVISNFMILKQQVRDFEASILRKYEEELSLRQLPPVDSVH